MVTANMQIWMKRMWSPVGARLVGLVSLVSRLSPSRPSYYRCFGRGLIGEIVSQPHSVENFPSFVMF
jgi:hypothetical protein